MPRRARSLAIIPILCACGPSADDVVAAPRLAGPSDTWISTSAASDVQGYETTLRVQPNGTGRALVRFDDAAVAAALEGALVSATLELDVVGTPSGWGGSGRTVGVYRMAHAWTEVGATWSCAHDTNLQNAVTDCAGADAWTMAAPAGLYAATPTATRIVTNGLTGTLSFDVTTDVQAWLSGNATNYGWLLAKTDETKSGKIDFGSAQSALAPRLILVDTVGGTTSATTSEPPPTESLVVLPTSDTHLRSGSKNKNFGTAPTLLQSGTHRTITAFDAAAITDAVAGELISATLELTIVDNADNWGTGRPIGVHRMTRAWTEGGATWNCPADTNPQNNALECPGGTWNMTGGEQDVPFAMAPTDVHVVANGELGVVAFDVTSDVAALLGGDAGQAAWLVRKTKESAQGRIDFGARESADAPRLVLVWQDGGDATGGDPCEGVVCLPDDDCFTSACDPASGECVQTPKADGSSCFTGNCITAGMCVAGGCEGDPNPLCIDDFDGGLPPWTVFEEIVVPGCHGTGIAEVVTAPVQGQSMLSEGLGLDVIANADATQFSNHVLAQRKIDDWGFSGRWSYGASFYIDPAGVGQTGPELSMQNTRQFPPPIGWATATAGIQYVSNPWVAPTWAVWTASAGDPRVAQWVEFTTIPLDAGRWYRLTLVADYDANRYETLMLADDSGLLVTWDLSGYAIALENKFVESAFWLTLESENAWNKCGVDGPFTNRVQYDDVRLRRPWEMCRDDIGCEPLSQCHQSGTCDPSTGLCTSPVAETGTFCEDGLACTEADTCFGGDCVPGPMRECDGFGCIEPTGDCESPP